MNKKFKYLLSTFLSVLFVGAITSFASQSLNISKNSNNIIQNTTTKQITSVPSPTADTSLVNTGVAVIKNGDNFILPSIYLSQLTTANNLDELKTFVQPYFYEVAKNPMNNLYIPITKNVPVYTISDPVASNSEGKITFSLNFTKYVENAVEISSPKTITVSITGFKSVSGSTNVILNPNFNFNDYTKGDIVNNQEILNETVIVQNLPDGASYTIEPIYETINNNLNSFDVNVKVTAYFNENIEYIQSEKIFKLTITTTLMGQTTSVVVKTNIDKSIFPCFVRKDMISDYISITNTPKDSLITINYDPATNYDNKKGEITFSVVISKIFQNGVVVDGASSPFNITITGFKKVLEPSHIKAYDNYKNFKPSEIKSNNIANYLDISLFPSDVVFSGGVFEPNDKLGTLTVSNLVASSAFINDEKYSLSTNYTIPTFTITGLLTQQPTTITVSQNGNSSVLASSLNNFEILSYVSIQELPPNANAEIRNVVPNNLEGKLTFDLYLSKYYNDEGLLKTDFLQTYTITNFKIISTTSINQKAGVDISNVYASDLNKDNIKDYVDFVSFPETASLYLYEFKNVSNLTGSLTFSVCSTQWYDETGLLRPTVSDEIKYKKFEIELSNFLTQQPTAINKNNIDNSGKVASEIDTNEEIEPLIEIVNQSNNPKYKTWWTAGNFRPNNLMGTLSFTITLNNYYDENGVFRCVDDYDYKPLILNFDFDNFKVVNKSIVTQKSAPSNILPTNMSKNDVYNYIDTTTFPEGTVFNYEILNPINVNGTFDLLVNASKWFNENGDLIKVPGNFFITIVGCQTQKPTDVIVKQLDLSNKLATEIDDVNKLSELIEIQNPYGKMVPGTSWIGANYQPLNAEGKLTVDVIINEYYNSDGNPVTKSSNNYRTLVKRITITGFKLTEKSILLQNATDTSQILASDVKNNNTWEQYVDFSRFPSRKEIISSETIAFDIKGTLIVNATIKYFYNESGNEIPNKKVFRIELRGFKQQTKVTRISPIDNIEEQVTTYDAIELYNRDHTQFINKYILVSNPPSAYQVTINSLFPNNANGSITVSVSIDNYYDENGNLMTNNLSNTINIEGFKKIERSSIIQNEYYDFSLQSAEDFKKDFLALSLPEQINKFKEITVFNSVPNNITFPSFNLEPINNLGQLSISTTASELYDSDGNIVRNQPITILFNGFKPINNSILSPISFEKNFPASDLVIDSSNFWNYFDASKFPSDVVVSNISNSYSNINGSLTTTATFNKYFGLDGNLVPENITLSSTINGFQKILQNSKLLQRNDISPELLNKSPTELILNNKEELFRQFVDVSLFPAENIKFGIDGTNFTVFNPIPNNLEGTIHFNVSVDKIYSGSECNLIIEPYQFDITIKGFNKTSPSTIKIKDNILPSQVTYNDLTFINFPTIPTLDQVRFGIRNDENGFIEIIIDNCSYYSIEGILQSNKEFKYLDNLNIKVEENSLPLILGLSIGLGLAVIAIVGLFIWWVWYKKTHEI